MYVSRILTPMQVIFFLSVTSGEWQVINDEEPTEEFNLEEENFLPAESLIARMNQGTLRNLASADQVEQQPRNPKKDLNIKGALQPHQQHPAVQNAINVKNNNDQKHHITYLGSMDIHGDEWQKSLQGAKTIPNDNNIDITNEGFLLVESIKEGRSRNGRKLTQFVELFSQDISQSSPHSQINEFHSPTVTSLETRTEGKISFDNKYDLHVPAPQLSQDTVQQLQARLSPQVNDLPQSQQHLNEGKDELQLLVKDKPGVADTVDDYGFSLKLACINEHSWECLMFKEDYATMRNNLNMSSHSSAKERKKRQVLSKAENRENSTRNILQVLGCENNDCFSGNPTDPEEEEVVPEFQITFSVKISTNLTNADLDDNKKTEIANKLKEQLSEIFKDVPGYKNVTVDPSKISVLDGNVVAPWVVSIDGGNPIFSGQSGKDVRVTIEDSLKKAGESFRNNITLEGNHPLDDFNSSEAADQVEQQANDPCKMTPSPCSKGFGSCKRLSPQGNGIQLKCISNCRTYGTCQNNGTCEKDMTGTAYCQCSKNWFGLYCEKFYETTSPSDQQTVPEYIFKSQTTFNTTVTTSDLTPEMMAEIITNFTQQLKNIFKNLQGLKNVTVNSIQIKDGQLIIDWEVALDPVAFTEKQPYQIGDIVRDVLQKISDVYKQSIVIGNQNPLHDFDYVDTADQIELAASDPCKTQPCKTGYSNCRAYDPVTVKCIHNCNTITACQNGGTCHLKPWGEAFCKCTEGWSGKNCMENIEHLDGGKITGIVVGSLLMTMGVLGCIFWFLFGRRRKVTFTTYSDEEESCSSASPYRLCVIDRPFVSITHLSIYGPSSNISPAPSVSSSQGSD